MPKGEETRQKILQCAEELFAEKGFSAVTMKDFCEKTGLSRGGLYRHFGSTEDIFCTLFSQFGGQQTDWITETIARESSAAEMLEALFARFMQEMKDTEHSLSRAIYEYAEQCDSAFLQKSHEASVARWQTLLEYGVRRGEFHPVDPKVFISLLLYAYQGYRLLGGLLPNKEAPEAILKGLRAMLLVQL